MSKFPWIKFTGLTLGLVGFGYGLMKVTTPTEEQLYKEMAPDLKRKVDASKAARMARSAEIKGIIQPQQHSTHSEATQPVWADPSTPKKT